MKTIGLIGGTSWVSTMEYYKIINQQVNIRLGGVSSAKILLHSNNFEDVKPPDAEDGWLPIENIYIKSAVDLQGVGAACLLLCSNTHHYLAETIQANIRIPLIHIGSVVASEVTRAGLKKVGILGTLPTMNQNFIKQKLVEQGIEIMLPKVPERQFIHNSILYEFGKGIFSSQTKDRYLQIISKLISGGVEGIIFGCTEIPILINAREVAVPIFDTAFIHARSAVDFCLQP